jgi:ribosomal-protein-alanine N-acetyltransferase
VIICRASGELIGTCSVHHPKEDQAEVGFLVRRDRWGTGVMQDVLPMLLAFARDELAKSEILAVVEPENVRCRRFLERFGFRLDEDGGYRWPLLEELEDEL